MWFQIIAASSISKTTISEPTQPVSEAYFAEDYLATPNDYFINQ